jgi:anti-sigma regulatory factor (Ser/Thr protein kinase)
MLLDDTELVVTELVTNAVRATGITEPKPLWVTLDDLAVIKVRFTLYESSVIIEVWDRSIHPPIIKAAALEEDDGRGLTIVNALCNRWSYFYTASGGKVVWGELAMPPLVH